MYPEIDTFLSRQGKTLGGLPFYKLVWSTDQTELRTGTFNEFYGEILLRSNHCTKLVPKYPFARDRWILEKYFPPEMAFTPELPDSKNGSYEPIFVFQDNKCNPLPVVLRVAEIIIHFDQKRLRSTQSGPEDKQLFETMEAREFAELLDSIDTTVLQSQLHNREAIAT